MNAYVRKYFWRGLFLLLLVLLTGTCGEVSAVSRKSSGSGGIIRRMTGRWMEKKDEKNFVKPSGKLAVGGVLIDHTYYVFDEKGRLCHPKKDSLVEVGEDTYYVSKKGTAISGWQIVGDKLYSVGNTGKVRRNTTYQGITLTDSGAAEEDVTAKAKLVTMKAVLSVTDSGMSKSQKLRACWNYLVSRSRFRYRQRYPNLNKKGWQRETAYNMLSTHSGNCYSFACAFAPMAEEVGYSAYVICGRVSGSRDHARDGLTRHAWVTIGGLHYDPEAQFAGWHRGVYGSRYYSVRHSIQKRVAY